MNKCFFLLMSALLPSVGLHAQTIDTLSDKQLKEISIQSWRRSFRPAKELPDVHRGFLNAGKRSEVLTLDNMPANLTEKTVRQVFAKIPGAFSYDMDGSGNQLNFSLRGLDPHRSWDMNVRQNGVLLNSDMYGYPASHYNPPMEAIERIELVRGTGSLQYGAMFGGMLNYITRQADTTRPIAYETQNAAGSFGLLSTFNRLSGRMGKFTWQAYHYQRVSEGYRDNGRSTSTAQFAQLSWQATQKITLKAELGRSSYLYQIPGPLTDSMFLSNPRQATRSRNYYSPDIWVGSLTLDWQLGKNTSLQWITSLLRGDRSSVQFLGAADKVDAINLQTGTYSNRQVDIDLFNSNTSEMRLLHQYRIGNMKSMLSTGIRGISNDLNRRQIGKGSAGTDYDMTLLDPNWGRDLHYKTNNIAIFAENTLYITPALSISPGIRAESGITKMSGEIRSLPPDRAITEIEHRFVLLGSSIQYKPAAHWRLYGGIAQAYRPVVLGEVIPANILERVDPNLSSSSGYNAELGIQGNWLDGRINLNAGVFRVQYNNRIGSQAFTDTDGSTYFLKTNIGNSRTDGVEFYLEGAFVKTRNAQLSLYTSTAYMDGRYTSGQIASGQENIPLKGNRIESVPEWTSRNGLQAAWKRWSLTIQHSFVAETFSDPFNTIKPNANGTRGIVPAYTLWDAHASVQVNPLLRFKVSVNNLADAQYFSKRPSIYPGPGVWPGDGRSIIATMALRL